MKKILIFFAGLTLICCTKKVGIDPALAYSDKALFDSCRAQTHTYYKSDSTTLLPGATGHGTFKLRFNGIAKKALTDNGKLPAGVTFPDGSFIIKDIYKDAQLNIYAFMYKRAGAWLWGEIKSNKEIIYSVNKDPFVCTGCHSQPGNRDLVVSFSVY